MSLSSLHATDSHLVRPEVLPRAAAGPGYVSLFGRWLGGAAQPRLAVIRSHTTDAKILLRRTLTHKADALVCRQVVKSHITDTRLLAAFHTISHTTSTALRAVVTHTLHHGADAALHSISVTHTHTTSAKLVPLHTWSHTTDTSISGSRFRAGYTDSLVWGTIGRTHTTDARPCNVYVVSHTTNVLRRATFGRTHKTDSLPAVTYQTSHNTDAVTLRVPLVSHKTDALPISRRSSTHKTSTVMAHAPIVGRWAAPRVGSRTPVQLASKGRQQANDTYPIAFLLVSYDRITPVLGAKPTVRLFKPNVGWVNTVGIVREVGDGWYELVGDAADRNVPGEILLMATAAGAEAAYTKFDVVVPATYDIFTLGPAEHLSLADATLVRAFASVALIPQRCLLQAVRSLWYWKAAPGAPLLVKAEDGTTAWQATVVVDPTIKPIRGMDPPPP